MILIVQISLDRRLPELMLENFSLDRPQLSYQHLLPYQVHGEDLDQGFDIAHTLGLFGPEYLLKMVTKALEQVGSQILQYVLAMMVKKEWQIAN